MRQIVILLVALIGLGIATPAENQPEIGILNLNVSGRIADEYLVLLREPNNDLVQAEYVEDFVRKLMTISDEIQVIKKLVALKSPVLLIKVSDENIVEEVLKLPQVKAIEVNAANIRPQQCTTQTTSPYYWGLTRMYEYGYSLPPFSTSVHATMGGIGIRVYILDSGIHSAHSYFEGRVKFGIDLTNEGQGDFNGHGTHIAGTVIGNDCGVARKATAVDVKILNRDNYSTTAMLVEGIDFVNADLERHRAARGVILIALTASASNVIDSAIEDATDAEIPVVVAAGNDDADACLYSPARSSAAITVGATSWLTLAPYSNWGSCVDILAHGDEVVSADTNCDSCLLLRSGTSSAAAHTAGVAALYLARQQHRTVAEVKEYILETNSQKGYVDLQGKPSTRNSLLNERCNI